MKKIVIGILSFMFMLTGCQSQDKEAPVLTLTKSRVQIALNDTFDYIMPSQIEKYEDTKTVFENAMKDIKRYYDYLVDSLEENYINNGMSKKDANKKAIEDARYVLPNACETKIVVTMNVRTLMNFFSHRCCDRSQKEIRDLANEMLKQVKEIAPTIFKKAGEPCLRGKCPEGAMSCGKIKSKIKKD